MNVSWAIVVALLGGAGSTILLSILWLPPKLEALTDRIAKQEEKHEDLAEIVTKLRVKLAAETGRNGES